MEHSRDGGPDRRVTHNTRVGVFVRYPAWSPRGDQIVFERGTVARQGLDVTLP